MFSIKRLVVCLFTYLTLYIAVSSANKYSHELVEDEVQNEVYNEYIRAEDYERERQIKRNRLILDGYNEDDDHYSRSRHRNMDQYINRSDQNENYEDDDDDGDDDSRNKHRNMDQYINRNDQKVCHPKKMFQYTNTDVKILLGTLHRMTTFWDKYYLTIIVDGLLGIRMAEGSIKHTLKQIKKSHPYYDDIKELYLRIKAVSKKIYAVISKRQQKYAQSFLKIIDKPFNFIRSWRNYRPDLLQKIKQKGYHDENFSDTCIKQLLGVNKQMGACYITDKCFKVETALGKKDYYLTHQVLYLLSGETHGCHDKLAKKVGSHEKLEHLYDIFGSNIYKQMSKKNFHKHSNVDIIAEQGSFCIVLGIIECSRMDTMRKVLHRVEQEGCVYEKGDDVNHNRKRNDAVIGKCSQHKTAVSFGYLAGDINFIANPPPCKLIS